MERKHFLVFVYRTGIQANDRWRTGISTIAAGITFIGLLALLTSFPVQAQQYAKRDLIGKNTDLRKVSSHLLKARKQLGKGASISSVVGDNLLLKREDNQLKIEIRLNELSPVILDQIRKAGVVVEQAYFEYAVVTGLITAADLDKLAAIPLVRTIHPQYGYMLNNVGAVANQADASIDADTARSSFGVDGAGLTVGILSDSVHDVIGGAVSGVGCTRSLNGSASQRSGDLPTPLFILDNGGGGGTDEGAAMAELIADLAPGADLMFHTAWPTEVAFAAGIKELAGCGADVIVDDVIYFAEPMFQDGWIARVAQDAVDAGIPYFSSAGNYAGVGAHDVFTDVSGSNEIPVALPSGVDFHTFAGGNEFASMTIPAFCTVRFILQWAEPFDGTLGAGAQTDLDLMICSAETAASCNSLSSTTSQGDCAGAAAGDPLEITAWKNATTSPRTFYLAVDHHCGPAGASTDPGIEFRIVVSNNCGSKIVLEPGVFNTMQIWGHSAAAGAVAVGAVDYREIDSDGNFFSTMGVVNVESFSSLGGDVPIYFTHDGTAIPDGPELRFKPEIAAPDGTNTTFFGFDADRDGFPNFFGTSAAAPHAAAVAALMLDVRPTLTPAGVTQVLTASAEDIESPGRDPLSGYGLINAHSAVQMVTDSGTGCSPTLDLHHQTITGSQYFRACVEITAGTGFTVASGAALLLEAGSTGHIILEPGFSVDLGASFEASIPGDF